MKRIAQGDLLRRMKLNRKRLKSAFYRAPKIFEQSPTWPGDWQGRCILALTSLYFAFAGYPKEQESVKKQLDTIFQELPSHLNEDGYFGKRFDGTTLDEQQVSGNSWYLRGIIEWYQITKSPDVLEMIKKMLENFVLHIAPFYQHYPLTPRHDGGVGGHEEEHVEDGWRLSSDIGCAFIMLDAMSEAYYLLHWESLKEVVASVIDAFEKIDFVKLKCQTHATLSCARGILTFYRATGEKRYLELSKKIFSDYQEKGMTFDYSNINWFGRPNTWTEPCCIVDSLVLAGQLFEDTGDTSYAQLFNRIYLNAFRLAQRGNGGAGCNTCLFGDSNSIKGFLYEAYFCCTMRFAEGLRFAKKYSASWRKGKLYLLLPQEGEFLINDTKISIEGDLYVDERMEVRIENFEQPFDIYLYVPSSLSCDSSNEDVKREENFLRFHVTKNGILSFKFQLEIQEVGKKKFVGDRLLVKRKEAYGDTRFDWCGEAYYYVLDYSRIKKESEAMSIVQTL